MSSGRLEKLYSQLPQTTEDALQIANSTFGVKQLQSVCESAEILSQGKNLNQFQAVSYLYQLLTYLIEDKLQIAKYFMKRIPEQCQQDIQMKNVWSIGKCMLKDEYATVYKLIANTQFENTIEPFIARLQNAYRLRCVAIVNLAYTSITVLELQTYIGFTSVAQLTLFVKAQNLSDQWIYDDAQNPTKITIEKASEDYSAMMDAQMLHRFTQYVCFMEAQQKLSIDEVAAANSNKSSKHSHGHRGGGAGI